MLRRPNEGKPYLLLPVYEKSSLLGLYAEFLNIRRSSEGGRVARVGPFGT